jgi:hypothetical protein
LCVACRDGVSSFALDWTSGQYFYFPDVILEKNRAKPVVYYNVGPWQSIRIKLEVKNSSPLGSMWRVW